MLKEQNEELISGDLQPDQQRKHISLKEASKRILKKQKTQTPATGVHFTDIVSKFVESERAQEKLSKQKSETELSSTKASGENPRSFFRHTSRGTQKRNSYAVGAVPLQKWKNVVRQHKNLASVEESTDGGIQETRSPVVKQSAIDVEASLRMPPAPVIEEPSQGKRKASLADIQKQRWMEMSVEAAATEPKAKEERIQEEEMTQTRSSHVRTPSPPRPPSGDTTDLWGTDDSHTADAKPDKEGLNAVNPFISSTIVAPSAKEFRTVQIEVEPVPSSGQPVAMERYRSEQRNRTPESVRRKTSAPTDRPDSASPVEFLPRRSSQSKNRSVSPGSSGASDQRRSTSATPEPNVSKTWV